MNQAYSLNLILTFNLSIQRGYSGSCQTKKLKKLKVTNHLFPSSLRKLISLAFEPASQTLTRTFSNVSSTILVLLKFFKFLS